MHDDAEAAALRSELEVILLRLDALGLHLAGAHVSMAVHALKPELPERCLRAGIRRPR